ncbi:uncharacterized protein A4U43_C03F23590 [Asparagus officinalis]|uniref:Major facilitator superfamily (MFS) profile domain-containing protein n=2 Tax=Asparagus officinalis TaxID=4686 RepID=A0A5P1FD89_ASPOF|nr:uncharacterized protein A4U43_C03F23590 [Asparagus officinalis]
MIALSVLLIGHSADVGWLFGDRDGKIRSRAIGVFVVGFWLLDVGNNATQSPCRALLADLTGKDHRRTRVANAYFSLFMALGNVLGYASGSYSGWFTLLPFTVTKACSVNCANLKSVFLIDIVLLAITTYISVSSAKEVPLTSDSGVAHSAEGPEQEPFLWELFGAVRYLPWPIWTILIVVALTWVGWFPFIQFDTDWMGREIYRGDPNNGQNYHSGVRMGAFGLMLNSIILGVTSVSMEKLCRKWGSGLVWGVSSLIMTFCFIGMLIIAFIASNIEYSSKGLPPNGIIIASLVVFAVLGAPLSVTYSLPYAMISSKIEPLGLGQGLAMGIMNLAIVIPQMLVSLGSGPIDQLFGGGNSPAFAVAAIASFLSGLVAIIGLPRPSTTRTRERTRDRR